MCPSRGKILSCNDIINSGSFNGPVVFLLYISFGLTYVADTAINQLANKFSALPEKYMGICVQESDKYLLFVII